MVSGGPSLHVACGVIMLFVYVVSCMHGRFDPVLLGISSGCVGVVVTLSATQKCRVLLPQVCIKVYQNLVCPSSFIVLLFLFESHIQLQFKPAKERS